MNYYEILKVSKNASDKEIKESYKKLIKKYHPDIYKGSKEFAEKTSAELNNAYATLSDSAKRAEYDLSLLPPTDTTSTNYSGVTYQNYRTYKTAYEEPKTEKENWNQKFKNKLYNYVDEHTKNLSKHTRVLLVLIIIFIAFLFLLISIVDYLKIIQP